MAGNVPGQDRQPPQPKSASTRDLIHNYQITESGNGSVQEEKYTSETTVPEVGSIEQRASTERNRERNVAQVDSIEPCGPLDECLADRGSAGDSHSAKTNTVVRPPSCNDVPILEKEEDPQRVIPAPLRVNTKPMIQEDTTGHNISPVDGQAVSPLSAISSLAHEFDSRGEPDTNSASEPELPQDADPGIQPRRSQSNEATDSDTSGGFQVGYWNPFWLRTPVLISFCFTFLAIAITVLVLLLYSQSNSGMSSQTLSNQYIWKYGPTAVIVLIAAFWNRVDYSCRTLSPWHKLRSGPSSPEQTLTLDYISPLSITTFFKSLRFGHWHVVAGSVGYGLLKLAIVLSTTIFTLELLPITKEFQMRNSVKFGSNASNFYNTESNTRPVYLYYGIVAAGLPYLNWTTGFAAVQPFEPLLWEGYPPNSTISAHTPVFFPTFDCEIMKTNFSTSYSPDDFLSQFNATLTTPDCAISTSLLAVDSEQYVQLSHRSSFPSQNYVGTMAPFACVQGQPLDNYLLTVSRSDSDLNVNSLAAVFCSPNYTIARSFVTADLGAFGDPKSISISWDPTAATYTLSGFTPSDLSNAVDQIAINTYLPSSNSYNRSENDEQFFQLMSATNGRSSDGSTLEPFLDPTTLARRAAEVWAGISSQLFASSMLVPSNETFEGQILYRDYRLLVRQVPAITLMVLFCLLASIPMILVYCRPWNAVPRDPNSIAGIASLCMASEEMINSLRLLGAARLRKIKRRLEISYFETDFQPRTSGRHAFTIKRSTALSLIEKPRPSEDTSTQTRALGEDSVGKPWQTLATRIPMRTLLLCLLLSIIVVLEILQRISDTHDGFTSSALTQRNAQYAASYIPALVLTGTAMMVDALDSSTGTFSPYYVLHKGRAPAARSILVNISGKIALIRLWESIKARQWVISCTSIGTLAASFLTIIVSALYTPVYIESRSNISLSRADSQFNLNWENSIGYDNQAGAITDLVLYSNLTYPLWTYDELVFPSIRLRDQVVVQQDSSSKLSIILPALRGRLNCTPTTSKKVVIDPHLIAFNDGEPGFLILEGSVPNTCPGGNLEEKSYEQVIWLAPPWPKPTGPQLAGDIWGLHCNGSQWTTEYVNPWTFYSWYPDNPSGCPSLAFNLGVYNVTQEGPSIFNATFKVDSETTLLACTQLVEEVDTKVTFSYPQLTIDLSNPPVPDEATAHYVDYGTPGNFIHEYQVFSPIKAEMQDNTGVIGRFWNAVVTGKDTESLGQLLGEENVNYLIETANHIYAQYMAQAISLNMRVPASSDSDLNESYYSGVLTEQSNLRIQQNRVSKIILQVLLTIIFVCAAGAWVLLPAQKLLYHNPCTIAGMLSMLVDGGFFDSAPLSKEAQYMSDAEIEKCGMLAGWQFSLGWWGENGAGNERFLVPGPGRTFGIKAHGAMTGGPE